jgi:putative ABC transport system permease protein
MLMQGLLRDVRYGIRTLTKNPDYPFTRWLAVTPSFFKTLDVPIVDGRGFTVADRPGALPVAIVNKAFVQKFFKTASPIGRRIRIGQSKSTNPWLTIVGVSGDVFTGDQDQPVGPVIFQPFAQSRTTFVYLSARASGPPLNLTASVRETVSSLNQDIPLYWVQTLDAAIGEQFWFVRVFGTMFVIFGGVALFLASVGLYAVMSFSVSRRTREVGIRLALGAQAGNVIRMIFGQGLTQLAIGMTLGLALAFGIARLLRVILFQVQPRDPVIFGGVVAVLLGVGLLACFVPARRATAIDPLVALRAD